MDRSRQRNDLLIQRAMQSQARMYAQHDAVLDDMASSVARLGDMSTRIGVELEEQIDLIEEVREEVVETETRLDMTLHKMDRLLSGEGRINHCCCIATLSTVAAVLLLLIYLT